MLVYEKVWSMKEDVYMYVYMCARKYVSASVIVKYVCALKLSDEIKDKTA